MATLTTRSAIKLIAPGNIQIQSDVPAPRIRPDYVIAEAKAWALNPTDIGHIDRLGGPGTIIGCDWSGVVTAVGENVTRFKPGDAVSGVCHGGNTVEPEDGAFANIVVSKDFGIMHKQDTLSFAEAASLGVGMATIGQAMYWIMRMRLPSLDKTPELIAGPAVFVYGGSSATGSLAIQAAKQSGYKVYTACSASNFDLVKSRGADGWFDYNLPTCADDILAAVAKDGSSSIGYIIDCIGNDASGTLCASILSPAGGHYHTISPPVPEPFKVLRPEETVTATTGLAYAMTGESFELPPGTIHPADPEQGQFAKEWAVLGDKLLAAGKIRPHPVSVREGGLEAVVAAIEEMRGSGPRGVKIVCTA